MSIGQRTSLAMHVDIVELLEDEEGREVRDELEADGDGRLLRDAEARVALGVQAAPGSQGHGESDELGVHVSVAVHHHALRRSNLMRSKLGASCLNSMQRQ